MKFQVGQRVYFNNSHDVYCGEYVVDGYSEDGLHYFIKGNDMILSAWENELELMK